MHECFAGTRGFFRVATLGRTRPIYCLTEDLCESPLFKFCHPELIAHTCDSISSACLYRRATELIFRQAQDDGLFLEGFCRGLLRASNHGSALSATAHYR